MCDFWESVIEELIFCCFFFCTSSEQCFICKKYFDDQNLESNFVFHEDMPYSFCSKVCMNVYILFRRKIVPCSWCKVSAVEL